jgi:uncharacterized protein (TIGR03435 family)
MTMIRPLIVLLVGVAVAFGQAQEFEVASIKPVADQPPAQAAAGLHIDGSQVRMSFLSLRDYLSIAYRVRVNQISGPDWLNSQRFDIAAKLPEGAEQKNVPEMLQALLVERFQMKAHREMREFPIYALEVDKSGLKITESAPADALTQNPGAFNMAAGGTAAGVAISFGEGSSFTLGTTTLETTKLTMGTLANMLTRFLDRPVINMTNLNGAYDLKLDLTPEDRTAMLIRSAVAAGVVLPPQALALLDNASGDSLSNSLKQVGLSLERRRAPLEVVVIDKMQRTPTEN